MSANPIQLHIWGCRVFSPDNVPDTKFVLLLLLLLLLPQHQPIILQLSRHQLDILQFH